MPNLVFLYYDPNAPRVRITDLEGDFSWGFTLLAKIATARNKVMISGWAQSTNGIDKVEVKLDWGEYKEAYGYETWQYLLDVTDVPSFRHYHFITVKATDGEGKIVRTYLHLIVLPATERSVVFNGYTKVYNTANGELIPFPGHELSLKVDGLTPDMYINSIKYDTITTNGNGLAEALIFIKDDRILIIASVQEDFFTTTPEFVSISTNEIKEFYEATFMMNFIPPLGVSRFVIASEGAILKTPDGVILEIPPNCLPYDMQINLFSNPIRRAGQELEDQELMLLSNYVLTLPTGLVFNDIKPKLTIPIKDSPLFPSEEYPLEGLTVSGFTTADTDKTVSIYPYEQNFWDKNVFEELDLPNNTLTIELDHFSGNTAIALAGRIVERLIACEAQLHAYAAGTLITLIINLADACSICNACRNLQNAISTMINFLNCLYKNNVFWYLMQSYIHTPISDEEGLASLIQVLIANPLLQGTLGSGMQIWEFLNLVKALYQTPANLNVEDAETAFYLESYINCTDPNIYQRDFDDEMDNLYDINICDDEKKTYVYDELMIRFDDLTEMFLDANHCYAKCNFSYGNLYTALPGGEPINKTLFIVPDKFEIHGSVNNPAEEILWTNVKLMDTDLWGIDPFVVSRETYGDKSKLADELSDVLNNLGIGSKEMWNNILNNSFVYSLLTTTIPETYPAEYYFEDDPAYPDQKVLTIDHLSQFLKYHHNSILNLAEYYREEIKESWRENGDTHLTEEQLVEFIDNILTTLNSFSERDLRKLLAVPSLLNGKRNVNDRAINWESLEFYETNKFYFEINKENLLEGYNDTRDYVITAAAFWSLPGMEAFDHSLISYQTKNVPTRYLHVAETQDDFWLENYKYFIYDHTDPNISWVLLRVQWDHFIVYIDGDRDAGFDEGEFGFFASYNEDYLINREITTPILYESAKAARLKINEANEVKVEDEGHPTIFFSSLTGHMPYLHNHINRFSLPYAVEGEPLIPLFEIEIKVKEYDDSSKDAIQTGSFIIDPMTYDQWGVPQGIHLNNSDDEEFDVFVVFKVYCEEHWSGGILWGDCNAPVLK